MSEKRRGLGRGLGALIPTTTSPVTRPLADRPVDVFFPESQDSAAVSPMAETVGASAIPANLTVLPGGRGGSAANLQSSGVQATVPAPAVHAPSALVSPRTDPDEAPPTPAPEALQTDPARHAGDDAGAAAVQEGAAAASVAPSAVPASSGAVSSEPAPSDPARSVPAQSTPAQSTPAQSTPEGAADQDTTAHGTTDRESVTAEGNDGGAGEGLVPVPGATFAELPVGAVCPNPRQPRQVFDEEELAELVHSIREVGVLQPVVVRRTAPVDGEARFELIMGERRLRAARDAGLERIPAIIRDTQDDALLRDALLENLHRSQLNPLEEAAAYQQLLDDFGCTHEELAASIGRSRPQISNTLRLLKLPALVQRRVAAGILSAGHARALLGLEDQAAMERLAQRTVAEGLSVRAVEEIVALGDGLPAKAAKRRPRAGSHTSELDDLASRLGDRLDTRVAIALGRTKGRLSIDFASVDDLNRIMGLLGPEVRGVFRG